MTEFIYVYDAEIGMIDLGRAVKDWCQILSDEDVDRMIYIHGFPCYAFEVNDDGNIRVMYDENNDGSDWEDADPDMNKDFFNRLMSTDYIKLDDGRAKRYAEEFNREYDKYYILLAHRWSKKAF